LKTKNLSITYQEFEPADELDSSDRKLLEAAIEAAGNAYAPYSGFSVGAAILLESGVIVKGTNVENAAFPSGICAERSAIAAAVSNYPGDHPVVIAIAAFTKDGMTEEPVTPCGNCRQVISEEEAKCQRKIRIILGGKRKIIIIEGIDNLLPLQFSKNSLRLNLP
jgi:cytidine deaminase